MKNSNDTTRNRTRYLPACSSVPQPNAPPRTGETSLFFLAHIYLINVANFPQFYNETLTVVIATARRYSTQQAACWYRLLTAYQGTGCDPSICFAVTSWVLPPKEHKINKRTCRFENKNWNAKSFT
jgi:hypothetical protein